jgi:4-diphosphocytidyl-2-C-methyl-D-erythritol kinase
MITEFAPAKINLALHVTGQRADGYHLLDSLVVFAGVGDKVSVAPAATLTLAITGPQAAALSAGNDNLVLRAARAFRPGKGARVTLEKVLPVASGIGGGSADAAAALRALHRLWNMALPDSETVLALGADVPVCLAGRPARMQGTGGIVTPLTQALPPAWLVLVNPRLPLPTPPVFAALTQRHNPPLPPMPKVQTAEHLARWLRSTRNDLEPAAIALAPVVAAIIASLRATKGCLLARMSGSGATCFGLYAGADAAATAGSALADNHPDWWVTTAPILP